MAWLLDADFILFALFSRCSSKSEDMRGASSRSDFFCCFTSLNHVVSQRVKCTKNEKKLEAAKVGLPLRLCSSEHNHFCSKSSFRNVVNLTWKRQRRDHSRFPASIFQPYSWAPPGNWLRSALYDLEANTSIGKVGMFWSVLWHRPLILSATQSATQNTIQKKGLKIASGCRDPPFYWS